MQEQARSRLLGVGLLAAGLLVGSGVGAAAGRGLAPDDGPGPTTTTTLPLLPGPDAFPGSPALPPPLGPVVADRPLDGTLVAIAGTPDSHLLVLEGALGRALPTTAPGRIAAVGDAWVAFVDDATEPDAARTLTLERHDVAEAAVVTAPVPALSWPHRRDATLGWFAPAGEGWAVHRFDLDDPMATVVVDPPVDGLGSGWILSGFDDRGAVLWPTWQVTGATGGMLVDRGGRAVEVPGGTFLLGDVAVAYDEDGTLRWIDRSTGEETGPEPAPVAPPAGGACDPHEAMGGTTLWACEAGWLVRHPNGFFGPVPAVSAHLARTGRWMVVVGVDGLPGRVRLVDLTTSLSTEITAPVDVLAVRP